MATPINEVPRKRNYPPKKSKIELAREFSELPGDALATSAQYAAWLNVSGAKLERDRWAGGGCPYIKHGKHVRYMKSVAMDYTMRGQRISTTQGT